MIKLLRDESGYSLVEVMASIVILSIAIIPMVSMFDAGLRAAVLGSNYDKARALANEKLEEVKALSFSEALTRYPEDSTVNCNPLPPAGSPVTSCKVTTDYARMTATAIESAPASEEPTSMARVTITVKWGGTGGCNSGGTKCYTTTGVVGK